jgi:glycosyltransferase involved in cell wall biosynthesis
MFVYTETMKHPFVSIALATYNGSRFLREQLDSLLAQTYSHFELVITDDGSSDETNDIIREYALRDSRIRWRRSANERGFVNNFTGAIQQCKGEFIFLCDQDDVWHPEKIASHIKAYDDTNAAWAYNRVSLIDEKGKLLGLMTDTFPEYYTKERRWILNYVWGSCILGCATSYRASLIRKLLPPDKNAPSHDSWLQMAVWPHEPAAIGTVLQEYRLHGSNTSDFKLFRTSSEERNLEVRAIADNVTRLISYAKNPKLQSWKRLLFLLTYVAKRIRFAYRSARGIIR